MTTSSEHYMFTRAGHLNTLPAAVRDELAAIAGDYYARVVQTTDRWVVVRSGLHSGPNNAVIERDLAARIEAVLARHEGE